MASRRRWRFAATTIALGFALSVSRLCESGEIQDAAAFGEATMAFDGATLAVSTGVVTREWELTDGGLKTRRWLRDGADAVGLGAAGSDCDWDLGAAGPARLVSLTAGRADDERFTSEHLRVVAEFEYAEERLRVQYVVWAYLGAEGLRTQLRLRAMPGYEPTAERFTPQVVESLGLSAEAEVRAFGLMQGVKTNSRAAILREEVLAGPRASIGWANGLVARGKGGGFVVVKESNKHTHLAPQADIATGGFERNGARVSVTGAGLLPRDVPADRFRDGWATWVVHCRGGADDAELALSGSIGSATRSTPTATSTRWPTPGGPKTPGRSACTPPREENVWPSSSRSPTLGSTCCRSTTAGKTPRWTTAASASEVQHGAGALQAFGDYTVYPNGWSRVRARAEELGVTLGLWAAWTAPLQALESNYDAGGFKYFKLDFANLSTRDKFDGLAQKARDLVRHTGHTASVNWDVTETAARMGYFCGREYGNVYLANRKTSTVRDPVLYVPHKVLGDAWRLSTYVNLNKFQVTVQNVDLVRDGAPTDAALHPHDYAVGIALMGSPIFFQETRHYEPAARDTVRRILSVYKRHRRAMYDGYVFPIGAAPDNNGWTGFQNHNPTTGEGYLTVFRERLCEESRGEFALRFVENKTLRVTDLLTGRSTTRRVGSGGRIEFSAPAAPAFLYLKYEAAAEPVATKRANPKRG